MSSTTKKYYTIRITGVSRPGIWYENKLKQEFKNAELKPSDRGLLFYVNPCQFVYWNDCEVISSIVVPKYTKP